MMFRKIRAPLLLVLLALFACVLPAKAAESAVLYDGADLLTDYEEEELRQKMEEIQQAYPGYAVVIVTTDEAAFPWGDNEAHRVIDDWFNSLPNKKNAIGYAISMHDRSWYIDEWTDFNLFSKLEAGQEDRLREGDYYGAFDKFLDRIDTELEINTSDNPMVTVLTNQPWRIGVGAGGGFLVALGIAYGASYMKARKHKDKQLKYEASNHVDEANTQVHSGMPIFVRSYTTRTKVSSSSHGGGGGHSGGGGHF